MHFNPTVFAIAGLTLLVILNFWSNRHMSAALDRLTASVAAAVAKINAEPAADDAALNALSDQLDAAVAGTPAQPAAPVDTGFPS